MLTTRLSAYYLFTSPTIVSGCLFKGEYSTRFKTAEYLVKMPPALRLWFVYILQFTVQPCRAVCVVTQYRTIHVCIIYKNATCPIINKSKKWFAPVRCELFLLVLNDSVLNFQCSVLPLLPFYRLHKSSP